MTKETIESFIKEAYTGLKNKEINFRNIGALVTAATIGPTIILPALIVPRALALDESAPIREYTIGTLINSFEIGAIIGYSIGERIDAYLGDETEEMKQEKKIKESIKYYSDLRNFCTKEELEKIERQYGSWKNYEKHRKKLNKTT